MSFFIKPEFGFTQHILLVVAFVKQRLVFQNHVFHAKDV
jgi:hypothetical protein